MNLIIIASFSVPLPLLFFHPSLYFLSLPQLAHPVLMVQDARRIAPVCLTKNQPHVTMSMEPASACPGTREPPVNQVEEPPVTIYCLTCDTRVN